MPAPTIKGIFVNSHIKAVEKAKGAAGLEQLRKRYGKSLEFKNSENVPIAEEVKVIEAALDVLTDGKIPAEQRAYEAGRLHFKNFSTTPLARIIFSMFRTKFKPMIVNSQNIAGHVFSGTNFKSEEAGPFSVRVVMGNANYPIDHFRGLFQEWMEFSGEHGTVTAREIEPTVYEYTLKWGSDAKA